MYKQIKEQIRQDYYQQNFPNDRQAWFLRNTNQTTLGKMIMWWENYGE